jgi:hypothetical protein
VHVFFLRRIGAMLENTEVEALVRASLTWLLSLLVATVASPALADPACVPAVAGEVAAEAPAEWRAAVDRLVRSTAAAGHPWSCGGGTVELRVHGDTATLIVIRRGEPPIERELAAADDVVPLGQALLSLPRELPIAIPLAPTAVTSGPPASPPAQTPASPRLLLGAGIGARLAGGADAAMLGGEVSAAVPLNHWLPSVHVRYDAAVLNRQPGMDEFRVAAGFARVFAWPSLDVRTGLTVAAAVLRRDMPRPAGQQMRVDGRLGAMAAVAIALPKTLRLVVGIDAEFAPARSRDAVALSGASETPAPFPFYTLGASLGVEVGL